jgi:hypothetical protein
MMDAEANDEWLAESDWVIHMQKRRRLIFEARTGLRERDPFENAWWGGHTCVARLWMDAGANKMRGE